MVKNLPANVGDSGLIPESGWSPGEGNGYLLQYSCLENSMDRGAWQTTVHGVAKSWMWLNNWTELNNWAPNTWFLHIQDSESEDSTNCRSCSVQFSSVAQSCLTLCYPMNRSTPGPPVHHQLLEFTQTHVHRVGDAIQPSHPLLSPSPPAPNPSKHQGLFQWVSSSHEVAKVLECQL